MPRKRSASPVRARPSLVIPLCGGPPVPGFWNDHQGRLIGAGGFAQVYLVQDQQGNQSIIKQPSDSSKLDAFCREVVALEVLKQAGLEQQCKLVELQAVFQAPRCLDNACLEFSQELVPTIQMEYIEGQDLSSALERRRLGRQAILRITQQVLQQLACLHAAGIVHRDVKLENIMLDELGNARLIDYGLACSQSNTLLEDCSLNIRGTIAYQDPEAFSALEYSRPVRTTEKSDIWALGLVAYQLRKWRDLNLRSSSDALEISAAAALDRDPLDQTIASMLSATAEQRPTALAALAMLSQ